MHRDSLLKHVIDARYVEDYRVWLKFNDGKSGEVDLSYIVGCGKVFQPHKDLKYFKNFKIENDTIAWENSSDIAPETLYESITNPIRLKKTKKTSTNQKPLPQNMPEISRFFRNNNINAL